MRREAVAVCFFLLLVACGYVGPVVPPSPELPSAVTNLAAVEQGNSLVITFDAPPRTTDSLAIKRFSKIDLRIGPDVTPFDFDAWGARAKAYEVPVPPTNDPDTPKPQPISKSIPVSEWQGQRVAVAVRTAVKQTGHFSQWSNRVVLDIVPPLNPPALSVQATKEGYKLSWPAEERPGAHYKVMRQGPHENAPVQIGTAEKAEYVDTTSQWDTPYTYTVVAEQGSAESLPSQPVSITHADTFAPSVPAGVTALAGPDTVEVSWSRVTDSNLKGYYLYRSIDGGAFERQGDLLAVPAFSDHRVEHGKTYRYAVTAVSQKGYESEKSATAEVVF